jgi:hypothetical protein
MTTPRILGCLLAALAAPCAATDKPAASADQNLACTYFQSKQKTSGAAELNIKNRKVSRVYFKSYYPGGPGELSFICDIDLKRADQAYLWQDKPDGTLITIKETGDTVHLVLDKKKKGHWLNFANLNRLSKWCGAGADVPEEVFIPLAGKQCKVTLPK